MKSRLAHRTIIMITIAAPMVVTYSCRQPYAPQPIKSPVSYLVVDGMINTGADSTVFTLSRTVNISAKSDSVPELDAQITVEGARNTTYPLTEIGGGRYGAPNLGLDSTKQYRLRIRTTTGKEYLSDMVQAKPTPSMDSVGFNMMHNGIQIYVNTHDPKNNTWYYRWDYQETWQFHAQYNSSEISDGHGITARTPAQKVYSCFDYHNSSSVTVGSSAKLKQDVIYQQPIVFIESTSEKIETRYSILLRQYALTQGAFNYWQNLQKNNEKLGNIFDAQPSEIQGNIHCISNPAEPVIGYINAGSVKQKRIYIDHSQLPDSWAARYPYVCQLDSELFCTPPHCTDQVALYLIPIPNIKVPVGPLFHNGIGIGYSGSTKECVDCTIRGTTTAPAFWRF